MLLEILAIIGPVFLVIATGTLYARRFPTDMAVANRINLDVFIPCLIFHTLADGDFQVLDFSSLALAGTLVVLGSGLLAWPLVKAMKQDTKTLLPPIMFVNSGNMGLPLALLAFGEDGLRAAMILFLVENILHLTLGMRMLSNTGSLLKPLFNPMFLACVLGIGASAWGLELNDSLSLPIEMMGQVAIPMMLFALGVRLVDTDFSQWRLGLIGAVLCPLSGILCALALLPWFDLNPLQTNSLLLFSVLPPAMLNFIFAEKFNQQPHHVANIVAIGNLFSLISLPALLWMIL